MDAHKPNSQRAFHKLNIKTAGCWLFRITLGCCWTANFSTGVTQYTEPRNLFWVCWGGSFFPPFEQGWIVKSVYPLSWELQWRQPDLTQHDGCARLIHHSLRCVGGGGCCSPGQLVHITGMKVAGFGKKHDHSYTHIASEGFLLRFLLNKHKINILYFIQLYFRIKHCERHILRVTQCCVVEGFDQLIINYGNKGLWLLLLSSYQIKDFHLKCNTDVW